MDHQKSSVLIVEENFCNDVLQEMTEKLGLIEMSTTPGETLVYGIVERNQVLYESI